MLCRFAIVGILVFAQMLCYGSSSLWPKITAIERTYEFADPSRASVHLKIAGLDEAPLYELICYTSSNFEGSEFDYSGDFECRLTSLYSNESHSTLLTYTSEQSADWESRARFFAEHFVGRCKESSFGGSPRIFRVRGMRLTLDLFNEHIDVVSSGSRSHAKFKSFSFTVSATPDPSARSAIADDIPPHMLPKWFDRPWLCLDEDESNVSATTQH